MTLQAAQIVAGARSWVGRLFGQTRCLRFVFFAAGRPSAPGSWASAKEAYERTVREHGPLRLDWANAPAGAIHYTAGDPGHIWVGTGDGMGITTNAHQRQQGTGSGDAFGLGAERRPLALIDEVPIPDILRGRGRYLGWTMWLFGHDITTTGPAGAGYDPLEEDDMFTDDDRTTLNQLRQLVGGSAGPDEPGIIQRLRGIAGQVKTTQGDTNRLVKRVGGSVTAPDLTALAGGPKAVQLDVDALADAIAAELRELPAPDAEAVVDLIAARLAPQPEPGAVE